MKKKILNHIQFLRGFSVILVFFYHLKLQYFDYGFLGVDIFFVVSGFVISSLIYSEIESTNKFNFLNFYIKRFKRIFPVLFFVISVSLLLIVFFQPFDLLLNNLKVYFLSLIGISNFYYLFSRKDYFDTVFDDPLAHTWSLGVEEQFYIIFPLFLFFLLNIKSYFKFIFIIIFTIIIGLSFSIFFQENTKLIFYSPLFRFWEFLIGTLTFFLSNKIKFKNNYLSLLILIILIIFILVPKNTILPITTMATCLLASIFILIYKKKKIVNLIIENKLFIFLGNISYSFYLWHLPIIYFYDLYFVENFFRVPLVFFLTFILSVLTYLYIEKKFRYKKLDLTFLKKITPLMISLLGIISLVLYLSIQIDYKNEFKKKLKDIIYKVNFLENSYDYSNRTNFYKISLNDKEVYRYCAESKKNYNLNLDSLRIDCLKKGKFKDRIFFIIGNSHTVNYIPVIDSIKMKEGDSVYFEHKSWRFDLYEGLSEKILNPNLIKRINELSKSYKEVFFVTSIEPYNLGFIEEVNSVLEKNIKIIILSTIPNTDKNLNSLGCYIKRKDCKYLKSKDFQDRNLASYYKNIQAIISSNDEKRILLFDAYNTICPNEICYSYKHDKDLLTHINDSHLTIEGSILMKKNFINFYNKTYGKK